MRTPGCPKCHKRDWRCEALSGAGISCCPRFWNSRISDQQFQAGQFPASCRAPQWTCRKDSLPLRRLESTTMSDSGRLRLSAQIVDLEQWCILG
jgi:hypothetical protein